MERLFLNFYEYVKSLFRPFEETRKRRALDFDPVYSPCKYRRLSSSLNSGMARNLEDEWCLPRSPIFSRPAPKRVPVSETIVLDDEDDTPNNSRGRPAKKFTSTPTENRKMYQNGNGAVNVILDDDDEEEVRFVKEFKTPKDKKSTIFDLTLDRSSQNGSRSRNGSRHHANSSLDYSYCLEDKIRYKKLLDTIGVSSSDSSSVYYTPAGKTLQYTCPPRASKILGLGLEQFEKNKKSTNTKDRLVKVLDQFKENEPVVVDSDSDSDVVAVSPPSPKPDIKVTPVNTLKTVVSTAEQTKSQWLQDLVSQHRQNIEERHREINEYLKSAEHHNKINRDIRLGLLASQVSKSLSIKDAVVPVIEIQEEVELPELTEQHHQMIQRAFRGDPSEVLSRKFNLNITRADIKTLSGLNWLNDEVINFYMNLIAERSTKNEKLPKTHTFNTFFYMKLSSSGPQSLRRWTKRVDIFSFDLICIPIHLGMHWCMAIVDFRDRSIRYYDSMGASNNTCLNALRNYLEFEHMDKKQRPYDASDFQLINMKDIPQQMNGSDCGMFACTFAEFVSRNAPITFKQADMPYLRKKMVVEILLGELLIQ